MTKNDIVRTLAEKYELEIASTRRVVQGTLDMVLEALIKGDKVELRNFGVFEVIERKGRIARNPKSRQEVFIPERKVVKFKPGKVMEDKITTPSMKEVQATTAVVVITVFLFGLYFWLVDNAIGQGLDRLLRYFSHR